MARDFLPDIPDAQQQPMQLQQQVAPQPIASGKDFLSDIPDIQQQQQIPGESYYNRLKNISALPAIYAGTIASPLAVLDQTQIPKAILAGAAQFGQGIQNAPYNVAKTLGLNTQYVPQPTDVDFNQVFGINSTPLTEAASAVTQYAPYALAAGATIPAQILGGAAGGFTQSKNPFLGAGIGGAAGLAGGVVSKVIPMAYAEGRQLLKGVVQNPNPEQTAQTLLTTLGKGRDVEENARSIAQDIINGHNQAKETTNALYGQVKQAVGNKDIYSNVENPAFLDELTDPNSEIVPRMQKNPDLKASLQNFTNNSTFNNGHTLQSNILKEANSIKYIPGVTSSADLDYKRSLINTATKLKGELTGFLQNENPQLLDTYNAAADNYKNQQLPYYTDPTIRNIVNGEYTDSSGKINAKAIMSKLPSIMKSPELTDIRQDVGPLLDDKLIYSELGKIKNPTPVNVLGGLQSIPTKGMSDYMNPEINQMQSQLASDIAAKQARSTALKKIVKGAGLLGLGVVGGPFIHRYLSEL